ncbi:phage tail assembly chaperone [Levilactobacillus angrenensis]|uniref:Phage portal protein n=1 Tax=Levilactobacillus angrenensis TaxID=2486020 RepID=A0ABW1UAS8_9LACO|nr:phage portal protein [Levilactobacillus angrenensis]
MADQVSIQDFIQKNEEETAEVKLDRFPTPFILRELSISEGERLRKQATKKQRNPKNGQVESTIDQSLAGELMLVAGIVQPDLDNKELQTAYGTLGDSLGTLKAMLKMSEFATLAKKFNAINGFDTSVDDDVEAVKN